MIRGEKFHGKPCRKCSSTLRYVASVQACVACSDRRRLRDAEKLRIKQAQYRKDHPDRILQSVNKYVTGHRPEILVRHRKRYRRNWAPGEHERAEVLRPFVTECACCKCKNPRNKRGWHADHCYKTGKFREFLCHPCNIILGFAERYGVGLCPLMLVYLKTYGN